MESKTSKEKTYYTHGLLICLGVMFALGLVLGLVVNIAPEVKEVNVYKTILRADNRWSETSLDSQQASYYYDLAGYAYEDGDYKGAERNCRLARDYFLKESQGYRRVKAELEASDIKDNLIDIYIEITDESIIATENLFEACEHFESASRYYYKYYDTNVPFSDSSYEMGGKEIEAMNDKINGHDDAVRRYNSLLEDFGVELDKRLE